MKLRPYVESNDYEYIKNWITDERTHALWCANLLPYPLTRETLNDFLDKDAQEWGGRPYIATEDDRDIPIGFLVITVNRTNNSAFCKCIMVDNSLRGKGYGTQMIKQVLKLAVEDFGVSTVRLNVFDVNESAKKCYLKAGLAEEGFTDNALVFGNEAWGRFHMVFKR